MSHYLLSTYAGESEAPPAPPSPDEMQAFMQRVATVEQEMEDAGAFVFGGALHSPDSATVIRPVDGKTIMTDGPFVESKEHIAGFYLIDAEDLDAALAWAGKVVTAIQRPIEVTPFRATGRVKV